MNERKTFVKKLENKINSFLENNELFRATISFDFIFTKNIRGEKIVKCVEINGQDSGISGFEDIPKHQTNHIDKLFAELRMSDNLKEVREEVAKVVESHRKELIELTERFPEDETFKARFLEIYNNADALDLLHEHNKLISDPEIKKHIGIGGDIEDIRKKFPYYVELNELTAAIDEEGYEVAEKFNYGPNGLNFKHAFKNDDLIKRICNDKIQQIDIIPAEYGLVTFVPKKDMVLPDSDSGFWVVKPQKGSRGRYIEILDNKKAQSDFRVKGVRYDGNSKIEKDVFQEFVPSVGADMAEGEYVGRAQSMRLLTDFVYKIDGTIDYVFRKSYQRVSANPLDEKDLSSTLVVNKSTGAKSFATSKEEEALARTAAEKIIQTLVERTPYGIMGKALNEMRNNQTK